MLQQQRILKGMVAVFVFCQCFTIVADVYELICTIGVSNDNAQPLCPYNVHIENLINVAHLMLAINSSVNFIFYMMNINYFKDSFVKVRFLCLWRMGYYDQKIINQKISNWHTFIHSYFYAFQTFLPFLSFFHRPSSRHSNGPVDEEIPLDHIATTTQATQI